MTMVIANPILCSNSRKSEFWFNGGYRAPAFLTERNPRFEGDLCIPISNCRSLS